MLFKGCAKGMWKEKLFKIRLKFCVSGPSGPRPCQSVSYWAASQYLSRLKNDGWRIHLSPTCPSSIHSQWISSNPFFSPFRLLFTSGPSSIICFLIPLIPPSIQYCISSGLASTLRLNKTFLSNFGLSPLKYLFCLLIFDLICFRLDLTGPPGKILGLNGWFWNFLMIWPFQVLFDLQSFSLNLFGLSIQFFILTVYRLVMRFCFWFPDLFPSKPKCEQKTFSNLHLCWQANCKKLTFFSTSFPELHFCKYLQWSSG